MSSFLKDHGAKLASVAIGAVGGYFMATMHSCKNKYDSADIWKSYESKDPVTRYITQHSLRMEPVQDRLMQVTMKHPWAKMMGAPEICQLLCNFIRANKFKKVIEVGVFTGFTTLGMAMALPHDGKIVGCDVSSEMAEIGRPFWKEAGVEHKIDLRIQDATKTLDELLQKEEGTYDLAFIDADKENYDNYYEKCLKLLRRGGIIALDNVLWSKTVLDPNNTKPGARELRQLNTKLKDDKRIDISMLIIGDGLTLAFKR